MTLTQIENYVLNFLQADFTNGNWTQAEVDQYIRDHELAMAAMVAEKNENFFKTSSLVSEVASTATVSLPTNVFRVLKVERVVGAGATSTNPLPLRKINRNIDEETVARGGAWPYGVAINSATAYPAYYSQHGQKQLELYPVPSQSNANSLLVTYIYRPASMLSGTHVPFQETAGTGGAGKDNLEEFHDILGKYAIEMCLVKEEAYPQADRIRQERLMREQQLVTYLSRMNVQEPRMVRQTQSVWDG